MGRLNDVSKDVRQGVMAGLRDAFLNWRKEGSPHQVMEKRFIELTRNLSLDDDLPSKTYAEGNLHFTHEFICILKRELRLKRRFASMLDECTSVLDKMNITNGREIIQN